MKPNPNDVVRGGTLDLNGDGKNDALTMDKAKFDRARMDVDRDGTPDGAETSLPTPAPAPGRPSMKTPGHELPKPMPE